MLCRFHKNIMMVFGILEDNMGEKNEKLVAIQSELISAYKDLTVNHEAQIKNLKEIIVRKDAEIATLKWAMNVLGLFRR